MASGLVPITRRMSAKRSLPPYSARDDCLRYGVSSSANSAEIDGVGLELEPDRRCRDHVIIEPMLLAVSDRRIFVGKVHAHLRVGVAGPVPSRQRVGAKGLFAFELEQPAAGVRATRLGRTAVQL